MVTAAAAMVLSQKLGFTVKLEEGRTSQQVYQALADGELHMAFEVWPESNLATFKQFTQKRSVEHVPYATLFGRSGIFESCSRSGSAADSCTENKDTNPILRCH
jgi:ABC-type proline/glycine betaine transport system substrate-binding protein